MSIHSDILLALDAKVESSTAGLGITAIKGWPGFDRADLSLPIAAVWWQRDIPRGNVRIGGSMGAAYGTIFNLAVFAQDEPRLMTYVSALGAMMDNWISDTIGSTAMQIRAGSLERLPVDDAVTEATRYAAQCEITFSYVR